MKTANLSASIRKLTSAKDDRQSTRAAGVLGIILLVITAAGIVLPDIFTAILVIIEKVQAVKRRMSLKATCLENDPDDDADGREITDVDGVVDLYL